MPKRWQAAWVDQLADAPKPGCPTTMSAAPAKIWAQVLAPLKVLVKRTPSSSPRRVVTLRLKNPWYLEFPEASETSPALSRLPSVQRADP